MTATAQDPAALLRRVIDEYVEHGETDSLDLIATDVRVCTPALRDEPFLGHEGFREHVAIVRRAFPDLRIEPHDVISDEGAAAAYVTVRATHTGDLGALPATRRAFELPAVLRVRVASGRVTDLLTELNPMDMLQQIGIAPAAPDGGGPPPIPAPVRLLLKARFAFGRRRSRAGAGSPPAPARDADAPAPDGSDPAAERSRAAAREVVERFIGRGDFTDVSQLAPDVQVYTHARPEPFTGPEGLREFLDTIRSGFPDLTVAVEEVIADRDRAVVRWILRGTNTGGFVGLPASGRRLTIGALEFIRFDAEGRISEIRLEMNTLSVLRQLGVAPARLPRPVAWLLRRRFRRP